MLEIELPSPTAQRLLGVIFKQITDGRIQRNRPETFLAFSEALHLLGETDPTAMAGARLTKLGLHDLHVWTEEHEELPKVTGLIVYKDTRRPHKDFPKWHGHENDPKWEAWWIEQANRAIDFDWSPYLPTPESQATEDPTARVREGEDDVPHYRDVVTLEPAPARLRKSRILVADILHWLSLGQSEADVMRRHPDLTRDEFLASLAYAEDRLRREHRQASRTPKTAKFSEKWGGKLKLPTSDPSDPKLTYLLEKYERLNS